MPARVPLSATRRPVLQATKKRIGRARTFRVFSFLVAGFELDRWYWETTIYVRKLLIVLIMVFIPDTRAGVTLQIYCGIWIIACAAALHWWADPYEQQLRSMHYLEALSLACTFTTLNACLLVEYKQGEAYCTKAGNCFPDELFLAIVIFIAVINLITMAMMAFRILMGIREKVCEGESSDNGSFFFSLDSSLGTTLWGGG